MRLAAGTGLASLGPPHSLCATPPSVKAFAIEIGEPHVEPIVLQELQNDFLKVTLYSDASASIIDVRNQAKWRMGPVALQEDSAIDHGEVWLRTGRSICEQYPGRFSGNNQGRDLRFSLLGRLREIKGGFTTRATLDGRWLEFRLVDVDDSLLSLGFPPPIESESLVLPDGIGRWVRKPLDGRFLYTFFSQLNMRWFGGLHGKYGWVGLFSEPNFADSGVSLAELCASPVWLQSMGKWSVERAIRYTFLRGGYVDLAKTYRSWAVSKGLHVPLTEKAERTPALKNLLQGRLISLFSAEPRHARSYSEDLLRQTDKDQMIGTMPKVTFRHADVQRVLRELPSAGVERALVVLRGWIRGGYDYSHPDIWPPDPALGTIQELQAVCKNPDPFTVGLHDNYQDIYAHNSSFPKGVNRLPSGALMPGGYWAGGQAYILNSRDGLRYARRNWNDVKTLKPRAMFIDTTSAVQNYQSYEMQDALTRSDDVENKCRLLDFFKKQGMVLGSEEGADFAIPFVDWNENRHRRVLGESVPIWPLVFHDAVACGRYTPESHNLASRSGDPYPSWLPDMLWGYFLLSGLRDAEGWPMAKQQLSATRHVDEWFHSVNTTAMIDHQFLTDDCELEQTVFSNGRSIVVNFSSGPKEHEGVRVRPHGYQLVSN